MYSQGILGTDVDQTLVGVDAVTADGHGLDHRVGVTLHDGAVHECTGVALVGIADHILLVGFIATGKAPLHTGGEASATTATQT